MLVPRSFRKQTVRFLGEHFLLRASNVTTMRTFLLRYTQGRVKIHIKQVLGRGNDPFALSVSEKGEAAAPRCAAWWRHAGMAPARRRPGSGRGGARVGRLRPPAVKYFGVELTLEKHLASVKKKTRNYANVILF